MKKKFKTSKNMALKILEETNVALLNGEAFGLPLHLRIAFTVDEDKIVEAHKRIKGFLCK